MTSDMILICTQAQAHMVFPQSCSKMAGSREFEKSGAMQPHTIGVQTGYSCQDHDAGFSARGAGGLEGLWFLIKTQLRKP
ncbi:uncharacterized protein TRIREDRAFT_110844 [Trichoderma reesei QM6a]|uniref:Predicted protein n=1 Tax=Hypocrea jecorina (strain QM6a) TaxID=431241 RepID=G0RT27_HYPJQ|nr:uncharacterized protein TRIREDRAFT_110844 [Trichoderma reesei QM6a]EGR45791.1 predicted protein [Trichoderma reesei QM6a]